MIKKLIWAAGFLCLALVGLVLLLPLALGHDAMRTAIARQLSGVTGAQVSFGGPIYFSVVPDFGIVAEELGYATGDGSVALTSERSVASVNLLSLFSDQIRITGIDLQNPRIVLAEAAATDASVTENVLADDEGDIFRMLSEQLQRFSFDRVEITNGEVLQQRGGNVQSVASAIDLLLSVPGIDRPASLAASAVVDGKRIELSADIGSLRELLGREPVEISLSAQSEQPPHPALANVQVTGRIQLADDGSYRITGAEIDSDGQKMALDLTYIPADRPFVMARIAAGVLDYADFQANGAAEESATAQDTGPEVLPDVSALTAFDVDVELRAEALRVGEAVARDLDLKLELRGGQLGATLGSSEIAGGSLALGLRADLNQQIVPANGTLTVSSVDIDSLSRLAGQAVPVSGRLSSQLQYAFAGTTPTLLAETINLRGTVSIANGTVDVPELAQIAGPNAGRVDALNGSVEIADVDTPISASGSAVWNGENIAFSSTVALADLFAARPSTVTLDVQSQHLNASYSGSVATNGLASGTARISAPSLSNALAWVGQNTGTPLGRFAFSGQISNEVSRFALDNASISLDEINASGAVAITKGGKPGITANLSVDALDFGALTGGGDAAPSSAGPAPIDLAVLRQFDADIRLSANRIGYGDIEAGPATATLSVTAGVARLVIPQAGFYGGAVTADITANGSGPVPAITMVAGVQGANALQLLGAAADFEQLEGTLTAEVNVNGVGADTAVFARALNGTASVAFADGALRGIDVAGVVRNVRSLLGGNYTQDETARTEFAELSVGLDIANGVGRTDNIRLLGPAVRMSGGGSVDLAAQTIDMKLDPRVVASLDGQGGDFDVSGLGMPIIVNGPLSGPSIYPDLSALLANPEQALQSLLGLGSGVGELSDEVSSSIESILETLENSPDEMLEDAAAGLLEQLTGGQGENGASGLPAGSEELLNTLFGGAFGGTAAPQSNGEAPVSPAPTTETPANPPATTPSPEAPAPQATPQEVRPEPQAPESPPAAPVDPLEGLMQELLPPGVNDPANQEVDELFRGLIPQIQW